MLLDIERGGEDALVGVRVSSTSATRHRWGSEVRRSTAARVSLTRIASTPAAGSRPHRGVRERSARRSLISSFEVAPRALADHSADPTSWPTIFPGSPSTVRRRPPRLSARARPHHRAPHHETAAAVGDELTPEQYEAKTSDDVQTLNEPFAIYGEREAPMSNIQSGRTMTATRIPT